MKKDNILIGRTLRAFEKASFTSGKAFDPSAWWPLNYINFFPLYSGLQTKDLYADYQLLRKSKSIDQIARAFRYPSAVWLNLIPFLSGTKFLGIEKNKRIKALLEFIRMLETLMAGNVFCEDIRNILMSQYEVNRLLRDLNWIETKSARYLPELFGRLHGDLLCLDEAIFWNANNVTREVHGPYKVLWRKTPCQLVIREYYRLIEPELLPAGLSSPYDSVKTFTIYSSKVHFDFPVLNDYTHDQPLAENTKAVFGIAERNCKVEVLSERGKIIKCCELMEKANWEISSWVESLDRKKQVLEGVKRHYYHAKAVRDLLGKRWQAPSDILQKVERGLSTFEPSPQTTRMTRKEFYDLYDPRIQPIVTPEEVK